MMRTEELKLVTEWDKTFARSEKVTHRKVTPRYRCLRAVRRSERTVFRTVCPDYGRARLSDDRLRPVLYR